MSRSRARVRRISSGVSGRSAALVPVTIFRSAAPVQPLTLTVGQTAIVLGVARSTAYELVRSGEIESIRLARRIVVPVAHLAERLGAASPDIRVPRSMGPRQQMSRRSANRALSPSAVYKA